MGTEIFPKLLLFVQFVIAAVGIVFILIVITSLIEYRVHKKNEKLRVEIKERIMGGLIAVVITLIVYFFFSAIGPAFRLLFAPSMI